MDNNPYINCSGGAILEYIDLRFRSQFVQASLCGPCLFILMTLNISSIFKEIELQYCEINQNLLLFLIQKCLNTENVKLDTTKMKKYVIFYIQLKQKINMIRGMNQKLFLFLIQKCLSTKNVKLNATKMKKYGTFLHKFQTKN